MKNSLIPLKKNKNKQRAKKRSKVFAPQGVYIQLFREFDPGSG